MMFQTFASVKFADFFKHNFNVYPASCPNGKTFALAYQNQVLVRNFNSDETSYNFSCDHKIDYLKWSPDSELICCGLSKKSAIQIHSMVDTEWKCKIDEGHLSIADVTWAFDSRHLLVVSEFHLKITVYSLLSNTVAAVIPNPKPIEQCTAFSACKKYLAVSERRNCVDWISLYTCDTWEKLKSFTVETKDLAHIQFSPSDVIISILEAYTEEFKILFYSIDGRLLGKFAKDSYFGLTSLSWSPDGIFIAVGDYFGKISILRKLDFGLIDCFHQPETLDFENVTLYKVIEKPPTEVFSASYCSGNNLQLFDVIKERPVTLPVNLTNEKKPKTFKPGVKFLQFSCDGKYIASINAAIPQILCIYNMENLQPTAILWHHNRIKCISWHSCRSILAIADGTNQLCLWMPQYCFSLIPPAQIDFGINNVSWFENHNSLLLNGKEQSCIVHLP